VNGTLAFIEDELVATHREDADGATPILHARNFDDFCPIVVCLFHKVGISKFILAKCLDVCNRFASKTFCEEINLITFHIFDDEDIEAL